MRHICFTFFAPDVPQHPPAAHFHMHVEVPRFISCLADRKEDRLQKRSMQPFN